mgnify:CR=1 FL=1
MPLPTDFPQLFPNHGATDEDRANHLAMSQSRIRDALQFALDYNGPHEYDADDQARLIIIGLIYDEVNFCSSLLESEQTTASITTTLTTLVKKES